MHLLDHLFVLLLVVVQPVFGVLAFRRFAAAPGMDRVRIYRRTLATEWLALAFLAAVWSVLGRSPVDIGFTVPAGTGFWACAALVVVLVVLLVRSWLKARVLGEAEREKYLSALGKLVHFLPRTPRDYRYFALLSVTAGVVEEIIYRGFLLWYLALHMPLWAAVVVSSLVFGVGHSYQGPAAALRTGIVGLAFAILYLVSGSIWLPIVAHAAVDLLQGALIFEVLRRSPQATGAQPATR